jgi:putative oxidoreductase
LARLQVRSTLSAAGPSPSAFTRQLPQTLGAASYSFPKVRIKSQVTPLIARRGCQSTKTNSMKNILLAATPRILLGLIFLLGAIDGFSFIFSGSHLIHPPTSDNGLAFEAGLKAAGFFWPLMKSIELVGALCLLTNRAPVLGLALLSPIMTVIVFFHFILNPGGIPLAIILVVTGSLLVYQYRWQLLSLAKSPAKRDA